MPASGSRLRARPPPIDIIGFLTARYFRMRIFGAIYRLITLFVGLFSAVGGDFFGPSRDLFGGYREALTVGAAC